MYSFMCVYIYTVGMLDTNHLQTGMRIQVGSLASSEALSSGVHGDVLLPFFAVCTIYVSEYLQSSLNM